MLTVRIDSLRTGRTTILTPDLFCALARSARISIIHGSEVKFAVIGSFVRGFIQTTIVISSIVLGV